MGRKRKPQKSDRKLLGNMSGNFLRKIFAKAFIYDGFKEMNIEEVEEQKKK